MAATNYIARLQGEAQDAAAREARVRDWIGRFGAHLASAKFAGEDPDGSRRDWIATGDVQRWLHELSEALTGA